MNNITTIFFDIGGVCLTNGWDHISRKRAAKNFFIDYNELETKHKPIFKKFEKGKISLDEYLDKVIFFRKRKFGKKDFKEFMFLQSNAHKSTLKLLHQLSLKNKYHLATINNESLELNHFRINKFNLNKYFTNFFSSCYLGTRKPEKEIFLKALQILQKNPEECLFIDDREENYLSAKSIGLNSIHLENPVELKKKLLEFNIEFGKDIK